MAALIAVLALVVLAGPAQTRTPGAAGGPAPVAFRPLVIDSAVPDPTIDTAPAARAGSPSGLGARVLADPGDAAVPTRPPVLDLPAVPVTAVAKAVPRPQVSVATTTGSGWRTAAYSWYGPGFYGHGTACGQTLTRSLIGVAHRSLPCGTKVTFRNPANGRTITVRVVDRGPYVSGRLWDLTSAACGAIGACHTGRIQWRLP